ncbi:MAG: Nif3-like dinuclear metal center hexameric protein, partial [Patescibacteria group bacterium]|nr:Nif3-like dinuclear metal center hexameric protein [Patescibacteria group bacterium]
IGIIVYHLPLDAHPQIGNNISLAKIIRLKNLKPFSVGFIGELPKATNTAKIAEIFKKAGINPERFTKNRKEIRKVAIVSGNASGNLSDWNLPFDKLPFDLFLTGEFHEHKAVLGEERNYDFMALGHDASETLGIQNLGNKIAKKFGIVHEFINI